jgi:hypothetical protein
MIDCGTLKISNSVTLQKWIDDGRYLKKISEGFVFNVYCGRFRIEKCICHKCRNKKEDKKLLINIISNYETSNSFRMVFNDNEH